MLVGKFGNVIGFLSVTFTVNDEVDLLPAPSVAEQFTVVLPIAKVLPDIGEQVAEPVPLTASVQVGGV